MQGLRQRLVDPAQRAQMRAENRASIEAQYPNLAEVLAVEPAVAAKVVDLLADHQLQMTEQMVNSTANSFMGALQARADDETRHLAELRQLLGAQGLEKYLDYADSLTQRTQADRFDTRLGATDKLRAAPVKARVKLDIRMKVNDNEPKALTLVAAGGEAISFEAGDGLIVEVIPTVFEDHSMDVRFNYYEARSDGRRRLPSSGGIIYIGPENSLFRGGGEGGAVIVGSRGYAVTSSVRGAELPAP